MKLATTVAILFATAGCTARLDPSLNQKLLQLKVDIDSEVARCQGTGRVLVSLDASGSLLVASPYAVSEHAALLESRFGKRAVRNMEQISRDSPSFNMFLVSNGELKAAASWKDAHFVFFGILIVPGPVLTNISFAVREYYVSGVQGNNVTEIGRDSP